MAEIIPDPNTPIPQGPSDKEKKYDRQLRLWAASGQQALEDANLLLINSGSGAVGVETLKNLVLPGMPKTGPLPQLLTLPRHRKVHNRRCSNSQ
jgi:amyloid beta precursor protein binding protein 1